VKTGTCKTCERPMVHLTRVIKTPPAGYVRHAGHGECGSCRTRRLTGKAGAAHPRMVVPGRCLSCKRSMVRHSTHRKRAGQIRHYANGLCAGCAKRVQRGLQGPVRRKRKHRPLEIDEQAVERAVRAHWDTPKLNLLERRAAIDYLLGHRYSSEEIARRIGCTVRCVDRRRAQLKAARMEEAA
jgi:hypothetical protein